MRALLPHPRAGLTLLELLVVLAILAITATVVPLAWRTPRASDVSALDSLTQTARREAIRRGQELRLRVDADGVWALAARDGIDLLETGRLASTVQPLSLRVDALGTCRPGTDDAVARDAANSAAASESVADGGRSFDMLRCRYRTVREADLTAATAPGAMR